MKTHLIFFAALPLLAAAALAASAQDENLAAQMAARRAAEDAGAPAAPAIQAEAAATNDAAASPTNSADAVATNAASAGATNTAAGDDEDNPGRKAALAAALKALQAANNNLSLSLASLQIITQRNIFDPNRVPYVPGARLAAAQNIETFSLRGVTTIDGKLVATFVGDGVKDYPAYRAVGETVGTAPGFGSCDFKIIDITKTNVTLLDTKFTPKAVAAATNSATNSLSASATNSAASEGGKVVLALGSSVAAAATNSATKSPAASATAAGKIVLALDQGLTRSDAGPWRSATALLTYPTFVARVAPPTGLNTLGAQMPFAAMPQITFDPSGELSISTDPNIGFTGNGRRNRRGGGAGGPGGRGGGRGGGGGGFGGGAGGGGFGGGAGGGFGGGGFGGGGAVAAPAAAPAAAPDPAVLARLQAQRAQEQ